MSIRIEISKTLKKSTDWPEWFKEVKSNILSLQLEDIITFNPDGTCQEHPLTEPVRPQAPQLWQDDGSIIPEHQSLTMIYQIDQQNFHKDLKRYEKKKDAQRALIYSINKSVSSDIKIDLSISRTFSQIIEALKETLEIDNPVTKTDIEEAWVRLMKQSLKRTSIDDWSQQVIKTFRIIEEWGCAGSKGWEPYVSFIDNIGSFSQALGLDALQHLTYMQRGSIKKEQFETFVRTYTGYAARLSTWGSGAKNLPLTAFPTFQKEKDSRPAEKRKCHLCGGTHHDPCMALKRYRKFGDATYGMSDETKERMRAYIHNHPHERLPEKEKEAHQTSHHQTSHQHQHQHQPTHDRKTIGHLTLSATINAGLSECVILDSGATFHLFNDRSRFEDYIPLDEPEWSLAGTGYMPLIGKGNARITIRNANGDQEEILLRNVYYQPDFQTNVVSSEQLFEWGLYEDNKDDTLRYKADDSILCRFERRMRLKILEGTPFENTHTVAQVSKSSPPKPLTTKGDATLWHRRLAHLGPEALEQCVKRNLGITIQGPKTVECETCAISKATHVFSKRPQQSRASSPFGHVSIDLFPMIEGYNGDNWLIMMTCKTFDVSLGDTLKDKSAHTLFDWIYRKVQWLHRHWGVHILWLQMDNEPGFMRSKASMTFLEDEGITVIPSSPYSSYQNGKIERLGQKVTTQARCLLNDSGLPLNLWPETVKTVLHIINRVPLKRLNWKAPLEALFKWLEAERPSHTSGLYKPDPRQNLSHLRVYGCRAYPLTAQALQGTAKRELKLSPHAHLGYLVGYKSSTQYVIWVPSLRRCINTPHVRFDESRNYRENAGKPPESTSGLKLLEETLKIIEIEVDSDDDGDDPIADWASLTSASSRAPQASSEIPLVSQQELGGGNDSDDRDTETETEEEIIVALPLKPSNTPDNRYPTPVSQHDGQEASETPPTASEPAQIELPEPSPAASEPDTSQTGFPEQFLRRSTRERKPSSKALEALQSKQKKNLFSIISAHISFKHHRRDLPPVPTHHAEALKHPFASKWQEAELTELKGLRDHGVYRIVPISEAAERLIPLKWVYTYKFNKDGYLERFKARLCVRGDMQEDSDHETYAATLTARSLRVMISIAAKWDLELKQYDVQNAFTNSNMDENVWARLPPGYWKQGFCWKLMKALYGLRTAPILWYRLLKGILESLGFRAVLEDSCIFTNGRITLFFFVDDIIMMFRHEYHQEWRQLEASLRQHFSMKGGDDVSWFLSLRIIRDRANRRIWLSQEEYVDKITTSFNINYDSKEPPEVPLSSHIRLQPPPADEELDEERQRLYQSKVGSILYAAVMTRPDVSKAAAELSRFNHNPGIKHMTAADDCLRYLRHTRHYALQFEGSNNLFECYSDAAFGDDLETRKSSQGYLMKLFGGPVLWKATRQDTVTTSSTEAELLALSSAAKEQYALRRLFEEIELDIEQAWGLICDNLQTLRLLTEETAKLTTRLRHVDIHRHWLRQEVQQGRIEVKWVETTAMAADGLTKLLPKGRFPDFIKQLGLVDLNGIVIS